MSAGGLLVRVVLLCESEVSSPYFVGVGSRLKTEPIQKSKVLVKGDLGVQFIKLLSCSLAHQLLSKRKQVDLPEKVDQLGDLIFAEFPLFHSESNHVS